MNDEFLKAEALDIGFKYPKQYVDFIEQRHKLEETPWWLLGDTVGAFELTFDLRNKSQASTKLLIPFAKSEHSEIIACFDMEGRVWLASCVRNDITDADWNNRFYLEDFDAWLDFVLVKKNA